ncbi:GDYXXLXY domain-containing protein [Rhodobacterales bacterium]|nr:GDYXXLXY domain-containing protein [Rhodobacterales bacterium]
MVWGLVALMQLAVIGVPLLDRLQVQMTGRVVPLELVPIDPRDLLRGDYVVINLAIGSIDIDVPGAREIERGDEVYVSLEVDGDAPARPVAISRNREDAGDVAIAGYVRYATDDNLRVDYGIDAFFLPEGEGLVVEQLDASRLMLDVSIADDGRSLPVTLLVDGKVFRSDGIF